MTRMPSEYTFGVCMKSGRYVTTPSQPFAVMCMNSEATSHRDRALCFLLLDSICLYVLVGFGRMTTENLFCDFHT